MYRHVRGLETAAPDGVFRIAPLLVAHQRAPSLAQQTLQSLGRRHERGALLYLPFADCGRPGTTFSSSVIWCRICSAMLSNASPSTWNSSPDFACNRLWKSPAASRLVASLSSAKGPRLPQTMRRPSRKPSDDQTNEGHASENAIERLDRIQSQRLRHADKDGPMVELIMRFEEQAPDGSQRIFVTIVQVPPAGLERALIMSPLARSHSSNAVIAVHGDARGPNTHIYWPPRDTDGVPQVYVMGSSAPIQATLGRASRHQHEQSLLSGIAQRQKQWPVAPVGPRSGPNGVSSDASNALAPWIL